MNSITQIRPIIREAHSYRFSPSLNEQESKRLGYCYAFHLVQHGRGLLKILNQTYVLSKGTLIYIPPQTSHSFTTDSEDNLLAYNIYCELWSDLPMSTNIHLAWDILEFDERYMTNVVSCEELDSIPHCLHLHTRPDLMDMFVRIVQTHQSNQNYGNEIAHSFLYGWILEIQNQKTQQRIADYRIQQLIDEIDKCPGIHPNFDDWMKRLGLKKTHFYKLFKDVTGTTPGEYVLRGKMRFARIALLESNQSITEIADALGYQSIHYFSRQFHKLFGCSPSAFRHHSC